MKNKKNRNNCNTMICPYCGKPVRRVKADFIYGDQAIYPDSIMYCCSDFPKCNSYVRAHNNTGLPLGELANKELRMMRQKAHKAFDRLWKDGLMTRSEAYRWLANKFNMRVDQAHIGRFSEYYCMETIKACDEMSAVHKLINR